MTGRPDAGDPRAAIDPDQLAEANRRAMPNLPQAGGFSAGMALGIAGLVLLGILTFTTLARDRAAPAPAPAAAAQTVPLDQSPPNTIPPMPAPVTLAPPYPDPPPPVLVQPPVAAPSPAVEAARTAAAERLKAPVLVIDNTKPAAAGAADPAPRMADRAADGTSADERFADRVAQAEERPARAVQLANTTDMVPQGAIIAAVLETAINSDLPGYTRAVVSRDVMSFDGRKVLIPRGSRLTGQYRSGVAAGQSRAFVVWTRLMRPDGVTVQLGSPAADPLGRAGLAGKVDSHFLKRFGSAILLSVVEAGLGRLQRTNSDIVVRSAQDAQSVAGVALSRDIGIPPTIKVPQGSPIRIFTARDLDFSGVAK